MNQMYLATPEGVSRLWQPTKNGLVHPSEAYIKEMREFIAPWGHTITEDRKQAHDASLGLVLAGVTGFAAKDVSVSRRGLFKLLGIGVAGLTLAQLLKADEVAAQFGGAGSTDHILLAWVVNNSLSPLDATTYYMAHAGIAANTSGGGRWSLPVPACTLLAHRWNVTLVGGTNDAAGGETSTHNIAKNDVSVASGVTIAWSSTAATGNKGSQTGLSVSFAANDLVDAYFVCPTWGTNPTGARIYATAQFAL